MKQGLQLKLSQQLALTPQLQQAIRLLQLSSLELQQEVQQALETNPLLEQDDLPESVSSDAMDVAEPDTADALRQDAFPHDLPLDTSWEALGHADGSAADFSADDTPGWEGQTQQSLQDYLRWQADLTPFSDTEQLIAATIIDAIDDRGYLTLSEEALYDSLAGTPVAPDDICSVLRRIQRFDPVGVAAHDLQECLLIQLSQLPDDTPGRAEACLILRDHLDRLANHDFRGLLRLTKLKEPALKSAIQVIRSLTPAPGLSVAPAPAEYIIPDILVSKRQGRWVAELNPDSLPKLRINQRYAALAQTSRNARDVAFIRDHLQDARWLIKSLRSRHETLLTVARCIVQRQQDFFENGAECMTPLTLADVAQDVEMHESTISRVTTQKYLHSPRGVFELKYFFSSHVNTEQGGEASSVAIRALVKKLIAAENPAKPLSDSKLTTMLSEQGIIVARRTVAKYRESLSIPPSNQRKQLV